MFLGGPWPAAGEPLFTAEDTAWAIALAEEERDTCPACGYPKAWCRDPGNQFAFEPNEEECFVAKRLSQHQSSDRWKAKQDDTKAATQVSARFRAGHEPDFDAGLNLSADENDDPKDRPEDR